MNNLAVMYQSSGQLDAARPLLDETLEARKSLLGPTHPDTLATLGNLAALYYAQRNFARSIPLFEEALEARRKEQGDNHPDTFFVAFNLGMNYDGANRVDAGYALMDEWLGRALNTLEPDQPPRDFGLMVGGHIYTRAGQYEKAEPLFRERATRTKITDGATSREYTAVLTLFGENQLAQRKWDSAESILNEALTIRAKAAANDWTTMESKSLLGAAYLGQKKYVEAELLLLAGYQGLTQPGVPQSSATKRHLAETVEHLATLYDAVGKPAETAKWRNVLSTLKTQ
jgi:tetratricopeptide (TPR) repeat protein